MDTVSEAEWSRPARSRLTLDLGLRAAEPAPDAVLSSPDVRLLKLTSPELERLVLQQYGHHHHHHHTHHQQQHQQHQQHHQQQQHQESSKVRQSTLDVATTEEYARTFVDVLLELHAQRHTDSDPAAIGSISRPSTTSLQLPVVFRTSPQTDYCHSAAAGAATSGSNHVIFSDSPPVSSQADDEGARLERKRARNRLAATRCRNRKLERIDRLQAQADRLRAVNAKLVDEVKRLRETVSQLRRDVLLHADCQMDVSGLPTTSLRQIDI